MHAKAIVPIVEIPGVSIKGVATVNTETPTTIPRNTPIRIVDKWARPEEVDLCDSRAKCE